MAVPKKRTSKSRKGMRRAHHRVAKPKIVHCACGEPAVPHRICPSCGSYKGEKVLGEADEQ